MSFMVLSEAKCGIKMLLAGGMTLNDLGEVTMESLIRATALE